MAFSFTLNKPRIHAWSIITLIMFACMTQANSDIRSVFDYQKARGGSRDFENKGGEEVLYVGHHGWPTKKILGFRQSKKAKITLETISFQQNISISFFQFSPFRYIQSERLPKTSFKLLSNQMFQIVIKFFKICKRLDKEREKTIVQQSMRKEKMRKVGLCFCFIKSFDMIFNHFFVSQAHLQPNFCFLISP